MTSVRAWLNRPSTRAALAVAVALYVPLAATEGAWLDPVLLAVTAVLPAIAVQWARLENRWEAALLLRRPFVTLGRIVRLVPQLIGTAGIVGALVVSDAITAEDVRVWHGPVVTTLLIAIAGQGWQVLGIRLANRGRGYKHRNVLLALAATTALLALVPRSNPASAVLFFALLVGGLALAVADGCLGLLSDLRSVMSPPGGIGIFIGTFNPIHRSHIAIMQRAVTERGLDRILVHPTVIPKLHAQALARGEIEIVGFEEGMRVYQKTDKADENVDYFPTGRRFYDHRTRELLIKLSLRDANMEDRVEVLSWPEIYADRGFYGVISEIKRRHPGQRLHGLHGSDAGGMWNRAIYDESGWIYPFPVVRSDDVSATAIRAGAIGMMTPTAEAVVGELRRGAGSFCVNGQSFTVTDGVLSLEPG